VPVLFLSYAQEDEEAARRIAAWLTGRGHTVFDWQQPERRGGRFVKQIQAAIGAADIFVVLLSPDYLESPWCQREFELAIHREEDLQAADRGASFIYVLKVRDVDQAAAGFLRAYDQWDLTNLEQGNMDRKASNFPKPRRSAGRGSAPSRRRPANTTFRNRDEELELVLRGLANTAGHHFWLVIGPPQLGKTWFLNHLRDEVISHAKQKKLSPWTTSLVDVRQLDAERRDDTGALLAELFGNSPATADGQAQDRAIAAQVAGSKPSHLAIIDSSDLLSAQTVINLRNRLGRICKGIQDGGSTAHFALVVACRRGDDWRGVTHGPRMSTMPLTEFKVEVVERALRDLASEMGRNLADDVIRRCAASVHRLSEGMPALLAICLDWIRQEGWIEMERMESQEVFEEVAGPCIQRDLLSLDSLFPALAGASLTPHHQAELDQAKGALAEAFRVLAPYRFFTLSHLRHHVEHDHALHASLTGLDWSLERLWHAISATALLVLPLHEPWQELQPAIRRLFYRYYFTSDEVRAAVHQDARAFVAVWADKQSGKEQVMGLVECLWHEAMAMRLTAPAEMDAALTESAAKLTRELEGSAAYSTEELRHFGAGHLQEDTEFQNAVSNVPGLFAKLVTIIGP
jgi:hypothetical protein